MVVYASLGALAVCGFILYIVEVMVWQPQRERLRFENGCVVQGYKKTLKVIKASDTRLIQIAGLWDVAPADDLWRLEDKSGNDMCFLHRSNGANEVLAELEKALPDFNVERCVQMSRDKSLQEEYADVWTSA